MRRGEVWLAEVGGRARPVVVLTRVQGPEPLRESALKDTIDDVCDAIAIGLGCERH